MKEVSITTMVTRLRKISIMEFGGKPYGRFKISYKRMQQITGKTILNDSFIDYLSEHCLMAGMAVINLGSEFAVIETGILSGYRNVPQGIIEKVLKE